MPQVVYDFRADASDLLSELSSVERAFFNSGKAATTASSQMASVDKTSKSTASSMGQLKIGIDAVDKAGKGMGGSVGSNIGMLKNFGESAAKVGSLLGVSGPVGIGIAAAVMALGGFVVALGAAVAGMAAVVSAAEDMNEKLKPFEDIEGFEPIAPGALDSIKNVNDSLDALNTVFQRAVVILGTEFAPYLEKASFTLVKLSLAGLDAWKAFSEGHDVVREFANFMLREFITSLTGPVGAIMRLVGGMGELWAALGKNDNALQRAKRSWDDLTGFIADQVIDTVGGAAVNALGKLNMATGDYDERARALLATQRDLKEGVKKTTKAIEEQIDVFALMDGVSERLLKVHGELFDLSETAAEQIESQWAKREGALNAEIALIERLLEMDTLTASQRESLLYDLEDAEALRLANDEDRAQRRKELAEEETQAIIDAWEAARAKIQQVKEEEAAAAKKLAQDVAMTSTQLAGSVFGMVEQLAMAAMKRGDEMSEQEKRNAKILFGVAKAAAMGEVIMNTAVAVMAALTVPPPVGPIQAAANAATGAAQLVMVAAQPPPQFPFGGVVEGDMMRMGMMPSDHGLIGVQQGEAVLNRSAVNRLGLDGVDALNRGGGSAAPMVIEMRYQHRIFDRFVQDNISKGGPLSDALSARRRVGHRRRK